ncbi:protein SCAR1 isoform X2 [Vigna unguiculata]|uniref:protein SCAR1 isoform X2 n=1 Tax=Vigna unguiculata TaxID=3917 RepID=UPI0010168DC7|nr:protein SCAR1 isoform X2 [Vigna unguiculata]
MPLVRLQVRNEFSLGQPELYREASREDPKAVLDGVAVAGLVGILRQLGDLADFAAEVFHGLQEQVLTTASRSHRLMVRVQNIEASLPALEKAVLAQTSHIHLAYTAGCEWHQRIKPAQNHFIYNDLPHFIMDSYEECREPPRVHLLDKFDTGGPGSCFRRYSDPTFFKRISADSDESYTEKTEKARKSHKSKKRSRRNGEILRGEQRLSSSGRMQSVSSAINGRTSFSQTASTIDMRTKSDLEHYSNSFDSKSGAGYIECVFHPSDSVRSDEPDYKEPSSSRLTQKTDTLPSVSSHIEDRISHDLLEKRVASSTSGVTWDEKEEIVESKSQACDRDKTPERHVEKHDSDMNVNEDVTMTNIDHNHILFNEESNPKLVSNRVQTGDIDSEPDNYEDALNTIESESENDIDYITKREVQQFTSNDTHGNTEAPPNLLDNNLSDVISQTEYTAPINEETAKDLAEPLKDNHVLDLVSKPNASNLVSVSPSDSENLTRDATSVNREAFRDLPESLQDTPSLTSEPHASNLGPVSPSDVSDSEEMTRDPVSFNKETFGNLPDSLQEILPLTSKSNASDLGPGSPSDVLYSEEIARDTVSFNKETFIPDSLQEITPLTSEPHAFNLGSGSPLDFTCNEETTQDTVSLNKEMFSNLPEFMEEVPLCTSGPHASDLSSVTPSDGSVSKEIANTITESHPSRTPARELVPHTHENSVLDHSVCANTTYIGPTSVNDAVSTPIETNVSSFGSNSTTLPDEEAGKISSNICKYEETRKESLADHSVRFWTNGGLLGLEPSKPPDFNKSNSTSQGPLSTKGEPDGASGHNAMQKSDVYKEEQESTLAEVAEKILKGPTSRFITSGHVDDQACTSEKTNVNSLQSNGFGQTERNGSGEIRAIAPGSGLPAAPDTKDSTEPDQGNGENSSRVFGLSRRLLINSFQRKVSFDEKSEHYNSLKQVLLEQSGQNGIVEQSFPETNTFKEKAGSVYPMKLLPPSPPLEHMKISFHPIIGLETSKLKLKFPDGSNRHESVNDIFPSFQLVPESSIPLDGSVSHSDDDDTFCRSSPYISDDCRSPRSDYNSDQWESDETPGSSDHEVHDSPRRKSSTKSVSNDDTNVKSGNGTCTANGVEHSLSRPLLDFPSYDNVNPALEKESKKHSKFNNAVMLHGHAEPTAPPPPPPLPPNQWWVSKPQLDMTNETLHFISEDVELVNDHSLPDSTVFQQPRFTKLEQIQINHDDHESYENIIYKLKNKRIHLIRRFLQPDQKETNQLRMGKETDEREDFLYQIRTKAFNLRPTVTGKSNDATGPTANVKVTAILEKANAIRQVVASDDGEDDDNWSDT